MVRFKRLLLLLGAAISASVGLTHGFVAFAGFGAALVQCPDGADCHDARMAGFIGVVIMAIAIGVFSILIRAFVDMQQPKRGPSQSADPAGG